jgi:hypothetical protein
VIIILTDNHNQIMSGKLQAVPISMGNYVAKRPPMVDKMTDGSQLLCFMKGCDWYGVKEGHVKHLNTVHQLQDAEFIANIINKQKDDVRAGFKELDKDYLQYYFKVRVPHINCKVIILIPPTKEEIDGYTLYNSDDE